MRDRAILLIGFAEGLRRSEIVSLDRHNDDTLGSGGWIDILEGGALIRLRSKTGWREVETERTYRGDTRWQRSSVKMLLERAKKLGLLA